MLIANYGLYWHADNVYWGSPNSRGELIGKGNIDGNLVGRGGRLKCVNFRDQVGIYALYDSFHLVYVGQAGGKNNATLFSRLKSHRSDHLSGRWSRFSWFGINPVIMTPGNDAVLQKADFSGEALTTQTVINFLEAIVIEVADGLLNKQGGRLSNAKKFEQITHDRAEGILVDRINKIERALNMITKK